MKNLNEQTYRIKQMMGVNEIDSSNTYLDKPKNDIEKVRTDIFSNSSTSEFTDYGISFLVSSSYFSI